MGVSDIIAVSITIADASPKAVDFKTPLLMAKAPFVGFRLYDLTPSGLSAMITDGFTTASRAYQKLSTMKEQSGGTGKAYVFARTTNQSHILRMIPDITKTSVGQTLSFTVTYDGHSVDVDYTILTNTVDAILDGIEALVDAAAISGLATTPDNATATHLDFVAGTAGKFVQIDGHGSEIELQDVSADGSLAAQLTAAQAALGENFYGLLIDGYSKAEIALAQTFAESSEKLFLAVSPDFTMVTSATSDAATAALAENRTGVFFTREMSGNQDAALLAKMLGKTPGSETWALKKLDGVTADNLSTTEFSLLTGKRGLSYTSKRGLDLTDSGRAGSGRPFDITHGADNQKANIETAILLVFANNGKVPFNNRGRNLIKAAIEGVLVADQSAQFIEPGWFVVVPEIKDISPADKVARILRDITYSAVLTGAIESATVAGTLSVSAP